MALGTRRRHLLGWRAVAATVAAAVVATAAVGCSAQPSATRPATSVVSAAASADAIAWPTTEWRTGDPEVAGFDSSILADGLRELAHHGSTLHSLLIARGDTVVLDAYKYPYDGGVYHDLASVTKSVTTTLVGIAADRGLLSLDAPMLSFFPDRTIANRSERKERVTVRHLASMTSGLDCRAGTTEVTLERMQASEDWVGFALDLPMVAEPGTTFAYCSPGMHILSAILSRATGTSAHEFARTNLFAPLGITDSYWAADAAGISDGWGDLALRPRDMARIGLLFLSRGRWDGQQIVSSSWVAAATTEQAVAGGHVDAYGYGWWISRPTQELAFFRADSRRGQHILVVPERDLVIVSTGGGFSLDEVMPFVLDAVTDAWRQLPANPPAMSKLGAALAALSAGPAATAVVTLPSAAAAISGRAITFDANPYGIRSATLSFEPGARAAAVRIEIGREPTREMRVGLDDRWRSSTGGRPLLGRGTWTDEETFAFDVDEGPGLSSYTLRVRISGEDVHLDILGSGPTVTVSGHMEA